jgi:hypothetical protein
VQFTGLQEYRLGIASAPKALGRYVEERAGWTGPRRIMKVLLGRVGNGRTFLEGRIVICTGAV